MNCKESFGVRDENKSHGIKKIVMDKFLLACLVAMFGITYSSIYSILMDKLSHIHDVIHYPRITNPRIVNPGYLIPTKSVETTN